MTNASPTGIIYYDGVPAPTLSDSADLSGGYYQTATLTFTLYSPSNTVVYITTVAVSGNGTYTASPNGETAFGVYTMKVSYSGNSKTTPPTTRAAPPSR